MGKDGVNDVYSVSLDKIIKEMQLELLCCAGRAGEILITTPDLNRPGLEISGYTEDCTHDRIQLMVKSEMID